jgi:hypothetical protein
MEQKSIDKKVEDELKRRRGPQDKKAEVVDASPTKFTRTFSDGSVWTYDLKKFKNGPIQTIEK